MQYLEVFEMYKMNIVEYLTKCEYCNNEFNYYDYQAHREICYLGNEGHEGYEADNENDNENNNENNNIGLSYKLNYPSRILPIFTSQNNTQHNILEDYILEDLMVNNITTRMNSIILNNGISKNELYKYCNIIYLSDPYECPICLVIHNQQNLQHQQTLQNQYIKVKCGHVFCYECSQKWFEYRPLCPICKCDIRV